MRLDDVDLFDGVGTVDELRRPSLVSCGRAAGRIVAATDGRTPEQARAARPAPAGDR